MISLCFSVFGGRHNMIHNLNIELSAPNLVSNLSYYTIIVRQMMFNGCFEFYRVRNEYLRLSIISMLLIIGQFGP